MTPKHIYVVEKEYHYEGSQVLGVYATMEKAVAKVELEIKSSNGFDCFKEKNLYMDTDKFRRWTNDTSVDFAVTRMEVE